jgi:lysophospholipase L1-like esterase
MIRSARVPYAAASWLRLSAALLLLCLVGASTASVSILPLGDSITHGGDGDGGVLYPTYRAWLYQDLRALGYDVDFVGSLNLPAAPAGSDPDNEGHAAYTAGQVLGELPSWLEKFPPPQVALVHLGTNDVLGSVPASQTVADLAAIVGVLRSRNPSMTILVAQIIPTSVAPTNERIRALNLEIAGLVALSTDQSPVVVVDQYTGFDIDADLQKGGVHPTTSGEKRMAARWEGALFPILARGVPPAATTAPIATPTVVTTAPAIVTTAPTIATTTASRFGSRVYRINGGTTPTPSGSAGATLIGSARSRVTASSAGSSLAPPATVFTRWYPAARWSASPR